MAPLDQCSKGLLMVDRKMYSRSRQKELLNRVVDEELYKPDDALDLRRRDRGISDLLMRQRDEPTIEHRRHRLSDLIGEEGPPASPLVLPPVQRPGFWTRLRRWLMPSRS